MKWIETNRPHHSVSHWARSYTRFTYPPFWRNLSFFKFSDFRLHLLASFLLRLGIVLSAIPELITNGHFLFASVQCVPSLLPIDDKEYKTKKKLMATSLLFGNHDIQMLVNISFFASTFNRSVMSSRRMIIQGFIRNWFSNFSNTKIWEKLFLELLPLLSFREWKSKWRYFSQPSTLRNISRNLIKLSKFWTQNPEKNWDCVRISCRIFEAENSIFFLSWICERIFVFQ